WGPRVIVHEGAGRPGARAVRYMVRCPPWNPSSPKGRRTDEDERGPRAKCSDTHGKATGAWVRQGGGGGVARGDPSDIARDLDRRPPRDRGPAPDHDRGPAPDVPVRGSARAGDLRRCGTAGGGGERRRRAAARGLGRGARDG